MGVTGGKPVRRRSETPETTVFARSGLQFQVLQADKVAEAVDVLANAFACDGQTGVTSMCGLDADAVHSLASMYLPRTAANGVSICAVEEESGRVVGVIVAEDFASQPPLGIDALLAQHPATTNLVGILDECADQLFRTNHELSAGQLPMPGKICHLMCVGVAPAWRRQHIALDLVKTALSQSAKLGFETVFADASGIAAQHLYTHCRMESVGGIEFADWECDGERPFADCASDLHSTLQVFEAFNADLYPVDSADDVGDDHHHRSL
eukprot:TRINITY_DN30742_c0_g1_i1.p1 TRINITY_DN30742_c0_g1~~TRINITY_DN30742_c0_g1_i1.p1  ORF type:complete len:288 (+),score=67.97 TRINITY_DN30742_c0_g1_i1:66-866(+)